MFEGDGHRPERHTIAATQGKMAYMPASNGSLLPKFLRVLQYPVKCHQKIKYRQDIVIHISTRGAAALAADLEAYVTETHTAVSAAKAFGLKIDLMWYCRQILRFNQASLDYRTAGYTITVGLRDKWIMNSGLEIPAARSLYITPLFSATMGCRTMLLMMQRKVTDA